MRFRFNEAKTTQAAAHVIRLHGGTMNYMVLIKLLYLADRKTLLEHGQPITGDRLVAMKYGPVLSRVLNFITEGPKQTTDVLWFNYIGAPSNYSVSLTDVVAPTDELSRYELRVLSEIHSQYGGFDKWELVERLHVILPEWNDPGEGAATIEFTDILRAEDVPEDEIARIKGEADSAWLLASFSLAPAR